MRVGLLMQSGGSLRFGAVRDGAIVVALLVALSLSGVFAAIDTSIQDIRFAERSVPVSGDVVLAALDAETLAALGTWPLPRQHYATLIDTLLDGGAWDVFVDIDLSAQGSADGDAALAAALERSGGYAWLAAFNQPAADGTVVTTTARPEFGQWASSFSVNVLADAHGQPRHVPSAIPGPDGPIPAMASILNRSLDTPDPIAIDFGIDAAMIPTFSMIDILEGRVDPGLFSGKSVIVGATALELQDILFAPSQGMLSGAATHILAAETIAQGRALRYAGPWPAIGLLVLVLAVMMAAGRRVRSTSICLLMLGGLSVVGESAALIAYLHGAIVIETAVFHLGLAALAVRRIFSESAVQGFLARKFRGERDHTEAVLRRVIADNFDGVIVVDARHTIISASMFARRWLGVELIETNAERALPQPLWDAVRRALEGGHTEIRSQGEASVERLGGQRLVEFVATVSETPTEGESERFVCLTFRDITEKRQQDIRTRYLAEHDPLTGAYSRGHFLERLGSREADVALLMITIDRIAHIRGTLGHEVADQLLIKVVERLRALGHTEIASVGGARFAIALAGEVAPSTCFEPIVEALTAPYDLGEHRAMVGVSAGFARTASGRDGAESILRSADTALAMASGRAGNRLVCFESDMAAQMEASRDLEQELRLALQRGEFELYYQGQFALDTGALIGAEALLRWNHPAQGMVGPGNFMPLAEETGFVVEMTRHILVLACQQALDWPADIRVAVNISALHFELGDLEEDIDDALLASGLPPERLEIEITEGALLDQRGDAIATLARLSARGIKIAIDDFGTGYSSLSYLADLPFDVLKIDKAFVDTLLEKPQTAAVVQTIIDLGRRLGKETLAEGVETEAQADRLRAMGCGSVQGYLFARPQSADTFAELQRGLPAESEGASICARTRLRGG